MAAYWALCGMRFAMIIICSLLLSYELAVADPLKKQATSTDVPAAPNGFQVGKTQSGMGDISAMSYVGHDLYLAARGGDMVIKLSDRNGDGDFNARSIFLIGFDGLHDIISFGDRLFISDSNGVWEVRANQGLVAADRPRKIMSIQWAKTTLAINTKTERLYAGYNGQIAALDLGTYSGSVLANGSWQTAALAVSPNGGLWAALEKNGHQFLTQFRDGEFSASRLELPANAEITDMLFWSSDTYAESYLPDWKSDMLVGLSGEKPMIARVPFNFGEISSEVTPLIDGFSSPSRIVGRRDVWGTPSALATNPEGRLVFADSDNGELWALEKTPATVPEVSTASSAPEKTETEIKKKQKSARPPIIRGSSITTTSGLNNGSALETDELLKSAPDPLDEEKVPEK